MADFVTIDEAARLEEVEYHTFYRKFQRNREDYKIKVEPPISGGKERIFIDIASLSKKARRLYSKTKNIEEFGEDVVGLITDEGENEEIPWYVDIQCQWFIENYKKHYLEAVELAKRIEEFIQYDGNNRTEYAELLAQELFMSSRSFFRKVSAYMEGSAWSLKMGGDKENYDFYKVFALCPKPKKRGKYPSLTDEMKAYIENIWFNKNFAQNHGTRAMLYEALKRQSELKGWELPSYPTITRYITELMETKKNTHYLVAQGVREWKRSKMIKARRNTGALEVMELIQGDAHTFDCWVSIKRDNGKISAIKPVLVGFIDTRSRCLVGWGICETPDAQIMKKVLLSMIYEKKDEDIPFMGVPKYLLIDNGKDFTAETLTGRPRKIRVDFDMETKGFYRGIGIVDDFRSLPYQAWSKGQIERVFGTICSTFTKWLSSYVGTLTGTKTIEKIKKNIPDMLKKSELMSLEEFTDKFSVWLKDFYHVRPHSGLKEQGEEIPVPIEVYKNAERYFKAPPPMEYAEVLLMRADEVRVYATGINKFGVNYMHDDLAPYIDQKVTVRWNPDDVTKLYVYNSSGSKICEALSQELLLIAPRATQKALEEHMRRQKRQLKIAREELEYLQMPYEERIANTKPKAIMLPETKEENPKVFSIPDDKQFREELKNKPKKDREESDYYQKQANKAMEEILKIQKLG